MEKLAERHTEIRARHSAITSWPWIIGISQLIVDRNGRALFFGDGGPPNAEFIAHAPEDMAWLLDEHERLVRENAALRRALRTHAACITCSKTKDYPTHVGVCRKCIRRALPSETSVDLWQFDEARFSGDGEE